MPARGPSADDWYKIEILSQTNLTEVHQKHSLFSR